ncbi:MAG TPA: nitroreductase family protein [Acidimicrobiales bacterium]|nr:nitroreductase family protein [Acidimicrobiales bacterium]
MSEFFDVVLRQRACREFRPDPLDDSLVERVLEAATHAPSAENRQPWVFIVVRDPARRAAIGDLNRRAWEGGGRSHSLSRLSPALLDEVDRGAQGGIAGAPVLVVVGGDTRLGGRRVLAASVFPAVENMLLAAGALGLGAALTTLPLVFGDELAEIVGFPFEVQPIAVVPLGWPGRALGPPRRRPVAEKAHRERFGSPW